MYSEVTRFESQPSKLAALLFTLYNGNFQRQVKIKQTNA